jgi:hypothetical protein
MAKVWFALRPDKIENASTTSSLSLRFPFFLYLCLRNDILVFWGVVPEAAFTMYQFRMLLLVHFG